MVADEFAHLLSLAISFKRNETDTELSKAEEVFFKVNLAKASLNADSEAAFFLCYARIQHGLGEQHLSWQQVDEIMEIFSGTDHAALHWLAYRFYGVKDDNEINYPNPYIDRVKAWGRLEKAIELGDGYAMYEKAFYLNRIGSSQTEIDEAMSLINRAIDNKSKAANYYKASCSIYNGHNLVHDEIAGREFLHRALDLNADRFRREDWIEQNIYFELGKLYLNGTQIERDETQAVAMMRNAAERGHGWAEIWVNDYDHAHRENPMMFFRADKVSEKKQEIKQAVDFKAALQALDDMVGLSDVKQAVQALIYQEQAMALRKKKGLAVPEKSYHMVLTGNPGTGKTELAKRMGKVFKNLGILATDKVHIETRSTLIGKYIGETAPKMRKAINKAKGGILFIDEAYSLAPTSERDFGNEAIQTLLYEMEENRSDVIIIVAGYQDKMQGFLRSNPGLASRFSYNFQLQNYSEIELTDIFRAFCKKNDYVVDSKAGEMVSAYFKTALKKRAHRFANAREVRTLFEKAVEKQSRRIIEARLKNKKSLQQIKPGDLPLDENLADGNILYLASEKKQD